MYRFEVDMQLNQTLNNFVSVMQSISAEQLMKTHCLATTFAKSLTLSVFPELTGPSITTPKFLFRIYFV